MPHSEDAFQNPQAVFPSKRDGWIQGLILTIAALAGLGTIAAMALAHGGVDVLIAVAAGGLAAGSALWFLYTTRYRITDTHLHMHSGPIHLRVALEQIRSVRPAGAFASSLQGYGMALSSRVLLVERRDGGFGYRISPVDTDHFLECLQARCPQLRREGESLTTSEAGPTAAR